MQALFVQSSITFASAALIVFVAYYTWLTRWANWKDPVGLTLVLDALLTLADIAVAIIRWFVPQTPRLLSAEIWAQGGIIAVFGLVTVWRSVVFGIIDARGYHVRSFRDLRRRPGSPETSDAGDGGQREGQGR